MIQNIFTRAIVLGSLCFVVGFVGGTLLTNTDREKTNVTIAALEAKVNGIQTATQKQIEATKEEADHFQGELKHITKELKQSKAEMARLKEKKRIVAEQNRVQEEEKRIAAEQKLVQEQEQKQKRAKLEDEKRIAKQSSTVQLKVYNTGETLHVGYTSYCVWRSWWSKRLSDNQFLDNQPDAMFLFVELIIRNNDKKARTIPPFYLIDENGAEYETSSKAWSVDGSIGALDSLNPSVQKQGIIVFDVPTNHNYKLKVSGGYWSTEDALITLTPKQGK